MTLAETKSQYPEYGYCSCGDRMDLEGTFDDPKENGTIDECWYCHTCNEYRTISYTTVHYFYVEHNE